MLKLIIYAVHFKNVDKILSAKGKTVGIFLPIEIDGIKNDYYFKFLITDVKKDKYPYTARTVDFN